MSDLSAEVEHAIIATPGPSEQIKGSRDRLLGTLVRTFFHTYDIRQLQPRNERLFETEHSVGARGQLADLFSFRLIQALPAKNFRFPRLGRGVRIRLPFPVLCAGKERNYVFLTLRLLFPPQEDAVSESL